MRSLSNIIIVIMFLMVNIFTITPANAQQPAAPNQPIELPEFIVTGKTRADIPGGAKRSALRPPLLSSARLDSLNPIEKVPLPTLPQAPLPTYTSPISWSPGYLDAWLGNYLTPMIDAGYTFDIDGYRIDLGAGLEASTGWVDNSDYLKFNVDAKSTYVAPDKFLFFGGSTTTVDLGLNNRSFKLYADTTAPSRNIMDIGAGVATDGEWSGIAYQGLISFSTRSLSTSIDSPVMEDRSLTDNVFTGQASVRKQWDVFDLGLGVDLRLRGYGGNAYPYTALSGMGDFVNDQLHASAIIGVQWATSTAERSLFGVLVGGEVDVFLLPSVTVQVGASSGLRPIDVRSLLAENPYMSDTAVIDMPYDAIDLGGTLYFHPLTSIAVSAGVSFRVTDRDVVWGSNVMGTFLPSYLTATTLTIRGDVRWMATSKDVVVADLQFVSASVADHSSKPYVAPVQASVGYDRAWMPSLRSIITLIYVGDRYADLANTITLQSYLDVRVQGMYDLSKSFSIQASVENLLGNNFQLWNGYKERGIFLRGGILWKF